MLLLRRLPRMAMSKVVILGFFNIGVFFILLMVAAYRLPGSVAGTLGATLPLLLIVIQWLAQGKRPAVKATLSAVVGLFGVLLLLNPSANLDPIGVACALGATFVIAIATLLTQHWQVKDILGVATWQLLTAGTLLIPVAWLWEGAPTMVTLEQLPGLFWLIILNTALGYIIAVNGIKQIPMQGTSMVYSFNDADAKERHTSQYFEIIGNRGLYEDGWLARTTVSLPWQGGKKIHSVEKDDGWQLYNTKEDLDQLNESINNCKKIFNLK